MITLISLGYACESIFVGEVVRDRVEFFNIFSEAKGQEGESYIKRALRKLIRMYIHMSHGRISYQTLYREFLLILK